MSPSTTADQARTFLVVTAASALVAWEIGFEAGAFDTFSYRRIFAVFVLSTVVLIATFVVEDEELPTTAGARLALAVPALYLVADVAFLTAHQLVVDAIGLAAVVAFPYTAYVIARVLGGEWFVLSRRLQVTAAIVAVLVAAAGFYVGQANDRFVLCSEFERIGDFVPEDCTD